MSQDRIPPAEPRSQPGEASRVYSGVVGQTYPAMSFPVTDVLMDRQRFDSEGDWAFCRFTSDEIPALRVGFQRGGFNIWADERDVDPDLLQLHLEVLSADGALSWLPTGVYPASEVISDPTTKDVRLAPGGRELLAIAGWPAMSWHARSADDELEVRLELLVRSATVLPDCLLPHAVFGMWETMGRARGWVRIRARTVGVDGHAFYDHSRVVHRRHARSPRRRYLYTTLALEDGSGIFGYHAVDDRDRPIDDYCFGVYVDPAGRGTFMPEARLAGMAFDSDGLPARWQLDWRGEGVAVTAEIDVRVLPLLRAWGSPSAPRSRADYIIMPLVLDGGAEVVEAGSSRRQRGTGLAEYFDATAWTGG